MAQAALVPAPRQAKAPTDDIIVLEGATWADYQRLLEIRGERPVPRFTYLEGVLELMNPSRPHETIKSMVGRLVEAWCLENDIDITPYGSWTLENETSERGVEPDECYVLGDVQEPERCDLAIEVVWTKGVVDKVEVYRKLGVRELWIWKAEQIQVLSLRDERYVALERSELLPGIDLEQLLQFVGIKPMTRAVREYTAALRASRKA
jgi:Uma2 family endonuclease